MFDLGSVVLTSYGRGVGHSKYEEYEAQVPKRSAPTEDHFLLKLEELRAKLKEAYELIERLTQEKSLQREHLGMFARRIRELEREVAELRQEGIRFSHFVKLIYEDHIDIHSFFTFHSKIAILALKFYFFI